MNSKSQRLNANVDDFYRGDTQFFRLKVFEEKDIPVDLSNHTFFFLLKRITKLSEEECNLYIQYTPPNTPSSEVKTQNGIVYFRIPSSLTRTLVPGHYILEVQLVFSDTMLIQEDIIRSFQTTVRVFEDHISIGEPMS